ncbi:hypothetical protein D0B54_03555 [Solimonas sp. K1W22B-7]|uniref:hypothetical protein n=1 Tax=Solimonas sp. K1W22B-7 TaxID=2303331 RepID=UPI000E32FD8A|nr:hypothetical protein [Solimonas sp. K1W22B-7]AXQ27804.1 hypothetical protein D0B54_03555 [Solimonas sp. K1W22B-7]
MALLCLPLPASAHSFGKLYNLPIPFWMYLYGAAAALLLSFLVIGYGVSEASALRNDRSRDLPLRFPRLALPLLQALSVASLAFTILAGFIGTQQPYFNFNMTWFWVVFLLGFTWLCALAGDLYAALNPWKLLSAWMGERPGRWRYPARLGSWPALLLYMAFIWLELFSQMSPRMLSALLLGYTALNLAGAWAFGRRDWFERCEFLGLFFALIGRCAPLEWHAGGLRLRQPFIALLREPAQDYSQLLFVLFMLSSTAFDGLHETVPWVEGFWVSLYHQLTPLLGSNIVDTYPLLRQLYRLYQSAGLLLSPLLYLAIYLSFLWLAKKLAGSPLPLHTLALRFACSLVPIALVYHVTHYYTLLLTQGPQVLRLASDPFGFGWNLLGTAQWRQVAIPDAGVVWHTQVALILAGHIVSVYLAHLEAMKLMPGRRQTLLSQLPMLLLMVAYTTIGLWVLSLPMTSQTPG